MLNSIKKIKIGIAVSGILINSGILGFATYEIVSNILRKRSFKMSTLSFKNSKNEVVGFDNVKIKQYEMFDSFTNNVNVFLDDYGQKQLIKKFIDRGFYGPEIAVLNMIVIGDDPTIASLESVEGLFQTETNKIFINPMSINADNVSISDRITKSVLDSKSTFKKDTAKNTWRSIQEARAEAILNILFHEYGHFIMSIYGYTNNIEQQKIESVPVRRKYDDKEDEEQWNKYFYDFVKNLFNYDVDVPSPKTKTDITQWFKVSYSNKKELDYIQPIDQVFNVKDLFEYANEGKPLPLHGDQKIWSIYKAGNESFNGYISLPSIEAFNYLYSFSEITTRKLMLAALTPGSDNTNNKNVYDNFVSLLETHKKISEYEYYIPELLKELKHSEIIFRQNLKSFMAPPNYYNGPETERILFDYVFENNSSQKMIGHNGILEKARKYVKRVTELMGYKNGADISFIRHKSLKNLNNNYYSEGYNEFNQIKLGGFIDKKDFKNQKSFFGYLDDNGDFQSLSEIKVFETNFKYKDFLLSNASKKIQGEKYSYFTKDFFDAEKMTGKELVIQTGDGLTRIELKDFRGSLPYTSGDMENGLATSYNYWMDSVKNINFPVYYPFRDNGKVVLKKAEVKRNG